MKKVTLIIGLELVALLAFGQSAPKSITKLFPCHDVVNPVQIKTIDSLKSLGYVANANSVHRVLGTNLISITFFKTKLCKD